MAALGHRGAACCSALNDHASRATALSCQRRSSEMREPRQREEDHDAGEREQQQRREHARDVEPVARLGDAVGEAGAGAGGARGDLGHHRADQRQAAGDLDARQHLRQRRRQLQLATAPASARRRRAGTGRRGCDRPSSGRAWCWRAPERTPRSRRRPAPPPAAADRSAAAARSPPPASPAGSPHRDRASARSAATG